MNIKTKSYLSFRFLPESWQQLKQKFTETLTGEQRAQLVLDGEDPETFRENIIQRHADGLNNKDYLFTPQAMEIVDRIQVKKMRLELLNGVVQEMATLIIDRDSFFRYFADGDSIYVIHIAEKPYNNSKDRWMDYHSFRIDTVAGVNYANLEHPELEELFLRMMIYLEFSDQITEVLMPNENNGKSRKQGKIINSTPHPFTIVNSKWNTTTIRGTGFKVSGHWRLQPCGVGLKDVKLIFIEEYKKDGLTRGMTKDSSS